MHTQKDCYTDYLIASFSLLLPAVFLWTTGFLWFAGFEKMEWVVNTFEQLPDVFEVLLWAILPLISFVLAVKAYGNRGGRGRLVSSFFVFISLVLVLFSLVAALQIA